MSPHEVLHPKSWKPARGYANGIAASGRMVFVGGMIGWNAQQQFETDDFVEQVGQRCATWWQCWRKQERRRSTWCG